MTRNLYKHRTQELMSANSRYLGFRRLHLKSSIAHQFLRADSASSNVNISIIFAPLAILALVDCRHWLIYKILVLQKARSDSVSTHVWAASENGIC